MGPGPSTERGAALLGVARASVESGLRTGRPLEVEVRGYPPTLREIRASFVTLRRSGALRGCTGSLEATRPLVADVAHTAFGSAFRDPRFAPLVPDELDALDFHVSVLGPLEPLPSGCEAELLAALRPGTDGLVLSEGAFRSTFLPAVWRSLPEPREFVRELKRKAGLPAGYWSDALRFQRYAVEEIS